MNPLNFFSKTKVLFLGGTLFLPLQMSLCLLLLSPLSRLEALPRIELSPLQTEISFDARNDSRFVSLPLSEEERKAPKLSSDPQASSSSNNHRNIPLTLTLHNDLKASEVAVLRSSSSGNSSLQVNLNQPSLPASEGTFLLGDPLKITAFEQTFFENLAPTFEIQTLNFTLDLEIDVDATPGDHEITLRFLQYQDNLQVADQEITLFIHVRPFMVMEVAFMDSSLKGLDFELVREDLVRLDKELSVKVLTNLKQPYRLFQRRGKDMRSHITQLEINEKAIFFEVDEQKTKGKANHDQATPLPSTDDLIFESDALGSSDSIPIIYSLQNSPNLKAGRYQSTLSFFIEPSSGSSLLGEVSITADLIVEVQKILKFRLFPENNATRLEFSSGLLDKTYENKAEQLLKVLVLSNTGRPYRFSHSLPNGLLNSGGGQFNPKQITYVRCNSEGQLLSGHAFETVDSFEQTVFESNASGDAATFYLRYRLDHGPHQMSGLYRSDLHFSLSDD